MPSHEEHCRYTFRRYGVRGEDIHTFIDEPAVLFAGKHRDFRHDNETVKLVGQMFKAKYGEELAMNIALDHIIADHREAVQKHLKRTSNITQLPLSFGEAIHTTEALEKSSSPNILLSTAEVAKKIPV